MLYITEEISISEAEIKEEFIRASGPGGQNVNKVTITEQPSYNIVNFNHLSLFEIIFLLQD